jgi:hypothetical protein
MERDVYEPIHSTDAVSSRVFLVFGKSAELGRAGSEIRNVFSNIAVRQAEHTVLSTPGKVQVAGPHCGTTGAVVGPT